MGKQGRGRRLTDGERLEIIDYARQNPQVTHVELAATYDVSESTIRLWRREANATKIRARCESGGSRERRRGHMERTKKFDQQLLSWIRSGGSQLPPMQVREKARILARNYEEMGDFKASSGWYYRYRRRFGLLPASTDNGDAASSIGSDVRVNGDSEGMEIPETGSESMLEVAETGSESMLELLASSEYAGDNEVSTSRSEAAADPNYGVQQVQEEPMVASPSRTHVRYPPAQVQEVPVVASPSRTHVREPEDNAALYQDAITNLLLYAIGRRS